MPNTSRLRLIRWPIASPLGALFPVTEPDADVREGKQRDRSNSCISLRTLEAAFDAFSITHGQTLSFHHHYREGDRLLNAVLSIASRRRIKGLTIAASSIFDTHAPLAALIEDGTVANVITDYIRGPAAEVIRAGRLQGIALLQSHGGRARAISSHQLKIDVAFVGASVATRDGNATGRIGAAACGPLGYAAVDAAYARATIVVAHELRNAPLVLIDIPAHFVDAVLQYDNPGVVSGISSGTTIPSLSPTARKIASLTADLIEASGMLKQGISLQSGAGGCSLAAVPIIGERMSQSGVCGSFMSGGITGAHVAMLKSGLFEEIRDVQCFDSAAVASSASHARHRMMSAAEYASPIHPSPVVNGLTVMLLGAAEVDCAFNVNVVNGANGRILGGPGGHPDTAQGAKLSIVTTELTGGGFAKIVPSARTVCTQGEHIDAVVTEVGIAVNPARQDLVEDLRRSGLPLFDIEALQKMAEDLATSKPVPMAEAPTLFLEHRDGRILDWA
ncbi:citrate lyase subunit alpha [Rhizobium giardinii]|uniref:Citrate lyase subunit alpha/citrate CoA-transferase n=1 Tax=Rhizobium giardinii TaxID=56731 RepID=A0A7W8X901_9HYPH|nr:citrate lyase subunit alpha [Rhizobium giardinii]MBB5536181.1 citrate lyase subunit alpha/citrate CoA-transferase [Rhizobium giardinii]